jgi:hypothetical protein
MAAGSQKPTFKDYQVKPFCAGCGRKLVASKEPAMWFVGYPSHAVYGIECFKEAA